MNIKSVLVQFITVEEAIILSPFFLKIGIFFLYSQIRLAFRSRKDPRKFIEEKMEFQRRMWRIYLEWFHSFSEFLTFKYFPTTYEVIILWETFTFSFKILFIVKYFFIVSALCKLLIKYVYHINKFGVPQFSLVIFDKKKY